MTKKQAEKRIGVLRDEIRHHRYLYHVKDTQEISDAALDSLKHELAELEAQFPDLVTSDSPTQRVGGQPLDEFVKVAHSRPVLSLQDAFSFEELVDWEKRNLKLLSDGTTLDYFAELKIDGLSVVLRYENGVLVHGLTRGDGKVGEDVTHNIKTIGDIPLKLSDNREIPEVLEVRGEIYMQLSDFDVLNKQRKKDGLELYANPRNTAAGTIRQLDPAMSAARNLRCFAFEIVNDIGLTTHVEVHDALADFGFRINPHNEYCKDMKAVRKYYEAWGDKRKKLPFMTDGVVVVVNNLADERALGSVGKAERYMIAYKFPAEQATSVVESIHLQVGRTGALTPVAYLQPTVVAGSTVSRASLHNADEIARLGVKVGDTVVIQKAGDIIPEVVSVLERMRTGKEEDFVFPKKCPVCGEAVSKKEGEVAHYCVNLECPGRKTESIVYFASRKGLEIEGLGPSIVEQLLETGLISDAADLFALRKDDLLQLDLFAEKKATKLLASIESRKKVSLQKFLIALGIRHVGEETSFLLAQHFGSLEKLRNASLESLEAIEQLGPVVAESIYSYFHSKQAQTLLEKFEQNGVEVAPFVLASENDFFASKTFLVTGSLSEMKRDQVKKIIRERGGKMLSSVSKNLDYLIVGESAGSKLAKAQDLGVTILKEDEFISKL